MVTILQKVWFNPLAENIIKCRYDLLDTSDVNFGNYKKQIIAGLDFEP